MRISHEEAEIIKTTILKYIEGAKVILFGSRAHDDKKGGDIDILVQCDMTVSLKLKLKILAEIEMRGVARKVDMLFETASQKEQNIFKTARQEGVLL